MWGVFWKHDIVHTVVPAFQDYPFLGRMQDFVKGGSNIGAPPPAAGTRKKKNIKN